MTRSGFTAATAEGWMQVRRFSHISPLRDGEREFLEAIPAFRRAQENNEVGEDGFEMPSLPGVMIGRIVDIDFIPDFSLQVKSGKTDGIVMVKQANRQP